MKRDLLNISILAVMFFSCKKEHNTPLSGPQKTYKVSLSVGFTQIIDSISNNGLMKSLSIGPRTAATVDTLKNTVSVINYQVYDSNMHVVRYINQTVNT